MNTLVIDIGNTNISVGKYIRNEEISSPTSFSLNDSKEEIKQILKKYKSIKHVAISSVVPRVKSFFTTILNEIGLNDILWVSNKLKLGININYPYPDEIGADRLANAVEAFNRWDEKSHLDSNIIICDFGTALTFDVINKSKGYVGGVICPGPNLMLSYLFEKTALLPDTKLSYTSKNIGKSTNEAISIGSSKGFNGMVKEILNGIDRDLGPSKKILTGGYAKWFSEFSDINADYDPYLTLRGVGMISDLNH